MVNSLITTETLMGNHCGATFNEAETNNNINEVGGINGEKDNRSKEECPDKISILNRTNKTSNINKTRDREQQGPQQPAEMWRWDLLDSTAMPVM